MGLERLRGVDKKREAADLSGGAPSPSAFSNDHAGLAPAPEISEIADHGFGRFEYFFSDAEADHRTNLGGPVVALGAAAEADCAAWRRRLDPAAVWLSGEIARWIAQPLATALGEDDAPLLPPPVPAPGVLGGLEPLNRVTVSGRLANLAGGLPELQDTPVQDAFAGLLYLLADPAQVAQAALRGTPLFSQMISRTAAARRPLAVPVEAAFALLPLLSGTPGLRTLMRLGYRLSMPTAQGALITLQQIDGQDIARLTEDDLIEGPRDDATIARSHGFAQRSPLAWYLFREAEALGRKGRLGPLGSRLLAETVIGLSDALPADDPAAALGSVETLWQAAGSPAIALRQAIPLSEDAG